MRPPARVETVALFPEVHAALIELLGELADADWRCPTACAGWSVHDVALHLLGGQIGKLSRGRDGFSGLAPGTGEPLPTFVNRLNDEWMRAARRISPALTRDMLARTGRELASYLASLDLDALWEPVSWAGLEPAPVWLDVAREFSEAWHHQQHIRDAVGRPGLTESRYLGPAIATFVRGLPRALAAAPAREGTAVTLVVRGEAGGEWTALREGGRWSLRDGAPPRPTARVELGADAAWRLFTRGLGVEAARAGATVEGDASLVEAVVHTVSII